MRTIYIDHQAYGAVFDTGASACFITAKLFKKLKNIEEFPASEVFRCINGTNVDVKRACNIEFVYDLQKYVKCFYIVENKNDEWLLIGNKQVLFMTEKQNKIPIQCRINTGNADPISWTRPIKSLADKQDFQRLTRELEDEGVIEESNSLWMNPVVLVRKKNGELRFCIDFRKLNDLVDLDHYEIPKISELLGLLRDAKIFTLIDLKNGFFNIDLAEKDREKTTFFTGTRMMQFKRMPQGFKNSPDILKRNEPDF
jgi:hypothetical protein